MIKTLSLCIQYLWHNSLLTYSYRNSVSIKSCRIFAKFARRKRSLMNLNLACRRCLLSDESNSLRSLFFILKNIRISLSFKNKQNSSKIEFNSNSIHLSINIRNHNKNDFLWSYNARSNFRIFLNYLYLFDI